MQTIEVAAPRLLFVGRGEEMTSEVSVKGTMTGVVEGVRAGAGAGAETGDQDMRVDGEIEARVGTMTERLNATVNRQLRVRTFGFLLGSFVDQRTLIHVCFTRRVETVREQLYLAPPMLDLGFLSGDLGFT